LLESKETDGVMVQNLRNWNITKCKIQASKNFSERKAAKV